MALIELVLELDATDRQHSETWEEECFEQIRCAEEQVQFGLEG